MKHPNLFTAAKKAAGASALCCCLWVGVHAQEDCGFDNTNLKFRGATEVDQARCLLRRVPKGGDVSSSPIPRALPEPLESLIGRPVASGAEGVRQFRERLRRYLRAHGISDDSEVGGSVFEPLARANNNDPRAPFARYLVIHDTSTPNLCEEAQFPADINKASWAWGNWQIKSTKWNEVSRYRDDKEAHLYITRNGDSTAAQGRTFGTPWRATKRERVVGVPSKGLFLHVENVQPRRFEPTGAEPPSDGRKPDRHYYKWEDNEWKCRNDRIAPAEGFSDPQLDRLALVYVAASARRGQWLIPAFHANVDAGIGGGHDDPQNFDLERWSMRLSVLLEALRSQQ